MHLHWEKSSNTAGDCCIRSLSWMGRVPDEIPQVRSLLCETEVSIWHELTSSGLSHVCIGWALGFVNPASVASSEHGMQVHAT